MRIFKLLFFVLLVFAHLNPRAQIVTIDNNGTPSGVTQASPVNIYWRRQVAQFVITAAELNAAGINNPNVLSGLGFYVASNPIHVIPSYTIKIKHVTQADVSTNLGANGWVIAKAPFNYSPLPGGYDMINFDNNFNWDGTQNIGVEICWSQVQPTWNSSGQCLVYTSANGYRYSRDDNAGSLCGNQPGTSVNYKPAVKLAFKTSSTWLGTQDNDWFNPNNWDVGVPSQDLNAIILSGTLNSPVINGSNAKCKDITIDTGNSLKFIGSDTLFVHGDWLNNGLLEAGQGTTVFRGDQANQINGISNQEFYNINIDSQNGATISSGSIKLRGTLDVAIASGSFNTNDSLIIVSDSSGTGRIGELKTKCLYTLDMSDSWGDSWNGGYISVYVNGVLEGNFFAKGFSSSETFSAETGATVRLDYTAGLYENENSYDLRDGNNNIIFSDGPTPTVGANVFSTTANCTFFNPIFGKIMMQRYIDAGSTHWRFLSAATSGATIADLNDDFITSGFIGSNYPNWPSASNPWPSIYFYDETFLGVQDSGFIPVTNVSNTLAVGQGIWAWSGDTIIGTQPFTIDMFGPPNVGDINLPITFTNTGSITDDGWNMLGNPYPSSIDWDSPTITKTNIDNAIYIWNPDLQQFASYVGGIGINGGSNNIASNQAFWVKANSNSPSIVLTEASKTITTAQFLKQNNSGLLRIQVQNNYGTDETVVSLNNYSNNNFESDLDALKMVSVETNLPSVSTLNIKDSLEYSINQISDTSNQFLLKVTTGVSGLHYINFIGTQNMSTSSILYAEDLITGTIHNITNNPVVTAYIYDTTSIARFLIKMENPLDVENHTNELDVNIFPNPSKDIFYLQGNHAINEVRVIDLFGNLILSETGVSNFSAINLEFANSGVYFVLIYSDNGQITRKITKQ